MLAPLGGAVADRFGVGFGQGVATVLTAVSFVILLSPTLDFLQVLAGSRPITFVPFLGSSNHVRFLFSFFNIRDCLIIE